MGAYFLDSSALIKRYISETGTVEDPNNHS